MSSTTTQPAAPPIKAFCVGAVEAAVFERQAERDGKTIVDHSVKIHKRYQDKEGNWQSSTNFFADELPKLSMVANEAYRFLKLRERTTGAQESTA